MSETKRRANYLHVSQYFRLNQACRAVAEAFESIPYLVGSVLERQDWRDVDVRLILSDDEFAKQFPEAAGYRDHDPKWILICRSISDWLSSQSGLPVDFQIQSMSEANDETTEHGKKSRSAIGFVLDRRGK